MSEHIDYVSLRDIARLSARDAQADRNPKGEDRKDGLRAKHESAVAKPCAQGEA